MSWIHNNTDNAAIHSGGCELISIRQWKLDAMVAVSTGFPGMFKVVGQLRARNMKLKQLHPQSDAKKYSATSPSGLSVYGYTP